LKKKKGNLIIQVSAISLFYILFIVCMFAFTKYKISAESEIVGDALVSSNLAALTTKNLDIDLLSQDPSKDIVIVKDPNEALKTFQRHLKYNLGLDEDYVPKNSISSMKGKVDTKRFIIYNVQGSNVTVYELNPATLNFTVTNYPNGKGNIYTPKGTKVEASTIHSQIGFTLETIFNNSIYVEFSEDTDILKE
jgi:hypothetical protein